jgi:hypothetical protein
LDVPGDNGHFVDVGFGKVTLEVASVSPVKLQKGSLGRRGEPAAIAFIKLFDGL